MASFAASLPVILFVFAGLFSPGPNVVMLMASGARFGFRATLPHLLGVPVGTGLLAAASALGVGAALHAAPGVKIIFQLVAATWILWLAWRMALAGQAGRAEDRGHPFTFMQAVLFQAVNPKVWAITLAASAGFDIGLTPLQEATRMVVIFTSINLFVCLFWTTIGDLLAYYLKTPQTWRTFMFGMALIMAASAVLIFL